MVEERVQDLNSVTFGYSKHTFTTTCLILTKTAKYKKRLNKRTIETLLKELFVLDDQEKNEETSRQYADKNNIVA